MTSPDINQLYQRVMRSNERLHQLKELDAPAILIQNEYRAFEDAVTALMRDEDIGGFADDIGAQAFSICFDHIASPAMPLADNAIQFEQFADAH